MKNMFLPPERRERRIKIEERFLLDLRAKINDLERELSKTKNQLINAQSKLVDSNLFEQREKKMLLENEHYKKIIKSQKAYIEELESEVLRKRL